MHTVELGHIGMGDGPTLVAVHGGLLGGRLTFGPVLADWAQRLRVLVPDRRGFEHSPGPDGPIAQQARDLEAFIDRHAGGHAHVLAFSYGGVVALTALQLERRLFASVTVVEAPAVTLCGRDQLALDLRIRLRQLYDQAITGEGRTAARDFFAYMDPRALPRLEALLAANDPGVHVALDELRVWRTPLSPTGLAGVDVPTLVVTGERSPEAMHRIAEHIARATGGRHHVQRAAGHAAHLSGRAFRDVLCAHVAAAEASKSWSDPVQVVPHDQRWMQTFEIERRAILDALAGGFPRDTSGDGVGTDSESRIEPIEIAHVGSTAVADLDAKPIIDIAIGVSGRDRIRPVAERLAAAGYATRPAEPNAGIIGPDDSRNHADGSSDSEHMIAVRRADGARVGHAHVVVHDGPAWRDYLTFRDALCADAALRRRYGTLKHELAARHRDEREAYTNAKTDFIKTALSNA